MSEDLAMRQRAMASLTSRMPDPNRKKELKMPSLAAFAIKSPTNNATMTMTSGFLA